MALIGSWAGQRAKSLLLRLLCLGVVIGGVMLAVRIESKAQPAPGEDGVVIAAATKLADAAIAGDKSVARKLLSLQFTYADETGAVHERRDFIADLKKFAASSTADMKVTIYGLVAMVTGHRKSAKAHDTFFLDIWVKQKGAWRLLTMQDVVLAEQGATPAGASQAHKETAKVSDCRNPCQSIPYRVRSPAEQDIVNAFQAVEKAAFAHDAGEWSKHIADEFVAYRSGRAPLTKSAELAAIARRQLDPVAEIASMRLSAYGDGAAMIANQVATEDERPLYRAARVWVRRNGQWQMAISVQTDIETAP